ncbi:MAG: hypothetical protein J6Z40_09275 [Oscillospiraceae bacterium]|nr:hypothetical protein [Oscillospiraceae bacterium]
MDNQKKLTVKSAFKKIYGKALSQHGFVWAKTKEPCFIRVVNNEIIHVFGIKDMKPNYVIPFAGAATLYRVNLLLDKTYRDMSNLYPNTSQFCHDTRVEVIPERKHDYRLSSPESIQNAIQESLSDSMKWVLPELNTVQSLQDFLRYYQRLHINPLWIATLPLKKHGSGDNLEDKVIHYLLDDPVSAAKLLIANAEEDLEKRISEFPESYPQENVEYLKDKQRKRHGEILESVYSFANDPIVRQHTLNELERRRKANLEILHSYGVL